MYICRERIFKDKKFSKPTDNHKSLDVRSSHQEVADRGRRNCTGNGELVKAKSEYSNYLLRLIASLATAHYSCA